MTQPILTALIVDDEARIRETLAGVLSDEGWTSTLARNGREGLQKFSREKPDLVLLDIWMSGMDGIATLQKMKELNAKTPIVIMSGHGTIETAVRATKLGAFDYLEKPLSLDKLLPLLDHAREIKAQAREPVATFGRFELIGTSETMNQVRNQVGLVAPRNAWVLITGENGTGKEVVARDIHNNSPRAKKPFVAVNCAAIPEELIESELFGHAKGAFTNAVATKRGRFEMAHQGTLFLDEIGDMSLKTQAKILRILQEQSFERVGDTETIDVDVRVIAATNKDLRAEILMGNFREDLFYRLNVVPFRMPPLRERKADILLLADYFLDKFAAELAEPKKLLSREAEQILLEYSWPGNVRELQNLLERLCIMVQNDEIAAVDLGSQMMTQRSGAPTLELAGAVSQAATLKQARNDFERSFILDKLEEFQWNVSKTAEAIGIERSNLHRKLKMYDIDPKRLKG